MTEKTIHTQLERYLAGTASYTERLELVEKLSSLDDGELEELMKEQWAEWSLKDDHALETSGKQILLDIIGLQQDVPSVHRIHFLRRGWFRYAAAVLIICGVGAYLWTNNNKTEKTLANDNKSLHTDIAPGGEKAILTLADGSKIVLDNAVNGNLATQGNAAIVKLTNGQIAYDLKGVATKEVLWNTMTTPVGGQYQVTLPDGTKVWLNAASSITYPAAFVQNTRSVKVTGEVYFEVAKNKQKPFIVDVDGKSTIEVLGTSFNINSYADDGNIKTTLLEGSVKVNRQVILKPGQQAQINMTAVASPDQQLKITDANVEQTLAWKNGLFNFNGLGLRVVMRQLERWYDIEVKYQGNVPDLIFRGKMYRSSNLSDALDIFQKLGVKFKLEGRILTVM